MSRKRKASTTSWKNTLQDLYNEHQEELDAKQKILASVLQIAENELRENGEKVEEYKPHSDLYQYMGTSMGLIAEYGLIFTLLATEEEDKAVEVSLSIDDEDQMNIAITLLRLNAVGNTEALIDGAWTQHYQYEDDNVAPVNCDKCEKRFGCEKYYQEYIEDAAKLANFTFQYAKKAAGFGEEDGKDDNDE